LALNEKYRDNPDAMFILWKDHTGEREAEHIVRLAAEQPLNYTLHSGNCYSAENAWSKMYHLFATNSSLCRDAYSALELCDWIPAFLTGCRSTEEVRMSRCVAGSKWMWSEEWGGFPPAEFLSQLHPGLATLAERLPRKTYTSDMPAGTLVAEWAERLGLPEGIVVCVGNVDAHSGGVGAGIAEGTMVLNLGTSACYMAVMSPERAGEKVVDGVFGEVESSILPGMIGLEMGMSAFGDVYAWFRRLLSWGVNEVVAKSAIIDEKTKALLIVEAEERMLAELSLAAAALPQREDAPIATDWFNGRRSPFANGELSATIAGLKLSSSAPEIFYALVEATVFATKHIIDHLVAGGVEVSRLIAIGGIAQKSPLAMQLMADVTGRRIDISDCKQAGAMGAVVFAATASGVYSSVEEAQRALCAATSRSYIPSAERAEIPLLRYKRYRELGAFTEQMCKK
jgi:L-ribulokinase